jgi:hypothetical protein
VPVEFGPLIDRQVEVDRDGGKILGAGMVEHDRNPNAQPRRIVSPRDDRQTGTSSARIATARRYASR